MRKNNLLKTLLIVLVIGWSGVVLMPTFQLNQQQKTAEEYYKEIEEATSLTRNDIKAALSQGNLELQVRDTFKGTNGKSVEELLEDVNALIELDEQIAENEPKSIKLGLDLQGGTYLAYEVDLPSLLESLSKQRDANFDAAIEEVKSRVNTQNEDFFDALQAVFQEKDMRLNRH